MDMAKLLLSAIQNYLDCDENHANHILNLILIPKYSALGAVIATLLILYFIFLL